MKWEVLLYSMIVMNLMKLNRFARLLPTVGTLTAVGSDCQAPSKSVAVAVSAVGSGKQRILSFEF